jgi:polyisoprenoid-binding protein YceI
VKWSITSGKLTVKARSRIHDTTTVWDKITGEVEADPDTLGTAGARATFTVDMTSFDAGDWLKNRKLRGDFEIDRNPTATFTLSNVSDVVRDGPTFKAKAHGVIRWRGKEAVVTLEGQGKLDAVGVDATATFDFDIRALGLSAPRFLMIKMSDEVSIEVSIKGAVRA